MSAPKIIIQILVTGTQIFGKALFEAGRQAVKNAKHRPDGVIGSDVAGVRNATTGSATDKLTREHRMTLDEAHLILNLKRGEELERVVQNYEHLFKANSPPEAPPKPAARGSAPPTNSHYLLSKVVRARERIEAELKVADEPPPPPPAPGGGGGAEAKS
ncbi:protein transporter [Auriscalpium vulgare]|uniref:Protein transporter n=1 Tax=Auriscalpium vulgare TaxID=40419 RepID=A0ACB8RQB9_9AGAM|nr:protein transporter [Auriscalpium vulgare]